MTEKKKNPFAAWTLAEVQADAAKVADIVAIVEKYQAQIPLPSSVKLGLDELEKVLSFVIKVIEAV